MSVTEYPEPQGCVNAPGFVKANPLNNDSYVEKWKDDPWYPAIKQAHDRLTDLIPGYNIAQIKEKFGGLRYYFDYPETIPVGKYQYNNTEEKITKQAEDVIRYAEAWVEGFEYARRNK